TEQFTSAPKLFEKIEGGAAKRNNLASHRTFLGAADGFVCFYRGVSVPQNAPVDHFIPWAFVLEDKVWNLVLACVRGLRRAEEQARHRHQGAEQIRLEMVPAGAKWWLARSACAALMALQSS